MNTYLPAWRIGLAGVAMIGVSYGFARYGYGLFAPTLRAEFSLSVAQLGIIGSATYLGYLTSLLIVGALATRLGPRPLVILGGLSSTAGLFAVALADNPWVLIAGLVIAGTASGWAWAPYSDVVDRMVAPDKRQRVMGLIPAGTAFGVALAGPAALLFAGTQWRTAWLTFALVSLAVTIYNAATLSSGATTSAALPRPKSLLRPGVGALFGTAASYGVVGAVYWTFAAEAVSAALGSAAAPLFWTLMGAAGTLGVFVGVAIARVGLRAVHAGLLLSMAVAIALLGIAPHLVPTVAVSAVLYGPAFMAGSSVLAIWSYRLYPEFPTTGFSATVFFVGLGTIGGPIVMGGLAEVWGLPLVFGVTAGLSAVTVAARPLASREWTISA